MPNDTLTHLYFLLDRSGSMASITTDVIDGFNELLAEQQDEGDDALMTLVQFDTVDPFELVADACPIREVVPLDETTFEPRGGTPLLDSLGKLLGRANSRAAKRAKDGDSLESILVVIFTDGAENSSREFARQQVFDVVKKHENEDDWTFAYLGANQDSIAEAQLVGMDTGGAKNWDAVAGGSVAAMKDLSYATSKERKRMRAGEAKRDFFEEDEDGG
jgi:hypothetical protein